MSLFDLLFEPADAIILPCDLRADGMQLLQYCGHRRIEPDDNCAMHCQLIAQTCDFSDKPLHLAADKIQIRLGHASNITKQSSAYNA